MTYLIILSLLLVLIAIRQADKARRWRIRNKELYRKALKEQHEMQAKIEQLKIGRT